MPSASRVYRPCASGCGDPGCAIVLPIIEAAKTAEKNLIVLCVRNIKEESETAFDQHH